MGRRVDAASTFENVITRTITREDCVIGTSTERENTENSLVNFGDLFCLRNKEDKYFCASKSLHLATLGTPEEKICLEFTCGCGTLSHGAFSFIRSHDPYLGASNILESITRFLIALFQKTNIILANGGRSKTLKIRL